MAKKMMVGPSDGESKGMHAGDEDVQDRGGKRKVGRKGSRKGKKRA